MVKVSQIFILISLTLVTAVASAQFAPKFRMEFSKREVVVGEQVMCNFIVYTDANLVDVEVAKFPEFRGYWVENLVLRQGPMSTQMGMSRPGNSVVVGTYLLIPIVDRAERSIDPMRVVMRNPATGEITGVAPDYVASEADPLVVKSLPPIPADMNGSLFKGAVGRFEFNSTESQLDFQKDEPFVLRFMLQGEGNFQEINDILLPLPPNTELLSRRSTTQGMGRFNSKIFEFTLTSHAGADLEMPAVPFVYFDPTFKRYVQIESRPIHLRHQKATVTDTKEVPIRFAPLQSQWRPYRNLLGTRYFVLSQIALAIVFTSLFLGKWAALLHRRRQSSPRNLRRDRWAATQARLAAGDGPGFLREAEALLFEVLCERAGLNPATTTRGRLIEKLNGTLPQAQSQLARNVFDMYQRSLYAPDHSAPTDLASLPGRLGPLLAL